MLSLLPRRFCPRISGQSPGGVDFSLCWAAQAHGTLQPPQGPSDAAKSCIGSIPLIFKWEAVLAASGRRWCLLLPWVSPLWGFISLSHSTKLSSPGGCSPWSPNLRQGSPNITSLLAAAEPPAPGHTWTVKWIDTETCQIGARALAGPGCSLPPPASCKENVFCLLGRAVLSHLCFSTG